jgi:hypothetical protein
VVFGQEKWDESGELRSNLVDTTRAVVHPNEVNHSPRYAAAVVIIETAKSVRASAADYKIERQHQSRAVENYLWSAERLPAKANCGITKLFLPSGAPKLKPITDKRVAKVFGG